MGEVWSAVHAPTANQVELAERAIASVLDSRSIDDRRGAELAAAWDYAVTPDDWSGLCALSKVVPSADLIQALI
jgi:hypothetical protein